MLKRILIITGIVIVGILIFFNWFKKDTKKHSPAATANYKEGALDITVNYCRPYAKGRVIFGEEEAEALQPYGKYWRLGANEATTFENNQAILFNEKELAPGKYAIYAYPGHDKWTVCVNKEWDRWGAQEADMEQDVFRTEVKAFNDANFLEQFEISFEPKDSSGTFNMVFHWDKTEVRVPLKNK
ncbi:MAG: hypothetical protein CFE21_07870 [Bacteroidetes bacterium B1(2017)]|nr:MAG: hypothetical protein CFE21_07870 [Bacteroidetes bacterium B1(2017)]